MSGNSLMLLNCDKGYEGDGRYLGISSWGIVRCLLNEIISKTLCKRALTSQCCTQWSCKDIHLLPMSSIPLRPQIFKISSSGPKKFFILGHGIIAFPEDSLVSMDPPQWFAIDTALWVLVHVCSRLF